MTCLREPLQYLMPTALTNSKKDSYAGPPPPNPSQHYPQMHMLGSFEDDMPITTQRTTVLPEVLLRTLNMVKSTDFT